MNQKTGVVRRSEQISFFVRGDVATKCTREGLTESTDLYRIQ